MSTPPDPPAPHRRRPRYAGTHPKRFADKYKEHDPERWPALVEHVRAKGRTPAGQHVPILVAETLTHLAPRPGDRAVDATLGWGGHARAILEKLLPGGHLLGLDADPIELPRTRDRLRRAGFGPEVFTARRGNYAGLLAALAEQGWPDGTDLLLADLGVSSMQIDDPTRGFSFGAEGPLDMRMNPARGAPAARWLARASAGAIERVLRENADEPYAAPIAEALANARAPLETTAQLAQSIRVAIADHARPADVDDSVRRCFQAIRIEVNDELGALDMLLRDLPAALRPGGRVVFLTFHSGEDRRVKHAFRAGERSGVWARVASEVVRPGARERHDNPRAKPAKLRWAVRT